MARDGAYIDGFGTAVALWGTTALIAAPGAPVAFVYARSGTTWSLQAVLSAPHSAFNIFGASIAVWGDTALVGGCCSIGPVPRAVYVFTRSGTSWSLHTTLTPPNGPGNFIFGTALGLSYQTAVVGGEGAYVYVESGGVWHEQAELTPTDRPPTALGAVLALQGNTVVAGAPAVMGAAYVFVRQGADWASAEAVGTASLRTPVHQSNQRSPSMRAGMMR